MHAEPREMWQFRQYHASPSPTLKSGRRSFAHAFSGQIVSLHIRRHLLARLFNSTHCSILYGERRTLLRLDV